MAPAAPNTRRRTSFSRAAARPRRIGRTPRNRSAGRGRRRPGRGRGHPAAPARASGTARGARPAALLGRSRGRARTRRRPCRPGTPTPATATEAHLGLLAEALGSALRAGSTGRVDGSSRTRSGLRRWPPRVRSSSGWPTARARPACPLLAVRAWHHGGVVALAVLEDEWAVEVRHSHARVPPWRRPGTRTSGLGHSDVPPATAGPPSAHLPSCAGRDGHGGGTARSGAAGRPRGRRQGIRPPPSRSRRADRVATR